METRTRRRTVTPRDAVIRQSSGYETVYSARSNTTGTITHAPQPVPCRNVVRDEVHRYWPPRGGLRNRDIGGPFELVKREYESNSNRAFTVRRPTDARGSWKSYRGPVIVDRDNTGLYSSYPSIHSLGDETLLGMGSTAMARVLPTNPIAGAAVFLGEMKEGLPSLVGSSLVKSEFRDYRKVGDEYLNVKFGWEPIISDVKKFAEAAKSSDKVLKQYRRDSGRNVRRRYSFPKLTETTETVTDSFAHPWPIHSANADVSYFQSGAHRLTTTVTKSSEVWFSGCFTYYLDPGDTALGRSRRHAQEANKLLGTRITPQTLWELAPWSWAIDYFTNIGEVIHNFSAFANDGLVLRWGYVMEKSIHEVTKTISGMRVYQGDVPESLYETRRTVRLRRLVATPYGFGLDPGGLSASQLAILAALGISNGPRLTT